LRRLQERVKDEDDEMEEGHRRRPHEPEVVAVGDEEASGEEVQNIFLLLLITNYMKVNLMIVFSYHECLQLQMTFYGIYLID